MPDPILIGIDTGGTFTDFICLGPDGVRVHKRPSTPDDPARAVLDGLAVLLKDQARGAVRITYGSTVATNAVLERKGARVVLLTTAGFEDMLEIGRQTRPELYALEPSPPVSLVERRRRIGVAERMAFDGRVLQPLGAAAVRRAVQAVRRAGGESIAVCLLHAYANGLHERRLGRALAELGVPCSLSHELVAEYREVERGSTTVLNAYVAPVMRRHLATLAKGVGRRASLRVMQSNGGAVSVATAGREAVRTLLSGPAGGAIGAVAAARRVGIQRVIAFDMGGTSTDVSLLDGAPRQQTEWTIGELAVKVPAIDIHTVGAGGGSIAARDAGGALVVGPQSAGADPGPACYGRGELPTVTDADLLLGRLVPEAFLGGGMRLDRARAARAVGRLARSLRLGVEATADGIVRVVNAAMERAIRRISVERGLDPRAYALVSFGGAGGMHAAELAEALDVRCVLVPAHPGLLSAWGAVTADVQRDYVQTVRLCEPPARVLARRLAPLLARARRELRAEGAARTAIVLRATLDVRYRGQSYELAVPLAAGYRAAFDAAHRARYGYADAERAVEVVNIRLSASAPGPRPRVVAPRRTTGQLRPHRLRWRGRWLAARRGERTALPGRRRLAGPLLITELSATTLVPPGWTVRVAPSGDLLMERR
ncbi:MAG: hydantoinase/oxoprolinase family protein [Deltaproteobacteria bacterium]|nr:hydantoinase/oxoprolinase family protein [Deltaproteobacteria bacterium]